MDNLELNDALAIKIFDYMAARKLSYNTIKTYKITLRKLFKDHKYLNKDIVRKLLKDYKHQNQRAVLILINNFCYHENIDFRMNIPSIKRQRKRRTIKTLPESEIEIMINSAPYPWSLMIKCIFKIGGGLRISEALKLSWMHIKWANWIKNKGLGAVVIKDSKGDDRFIPIPNSIMLELYELAKQRNILNEFGIPVGGMIFTIPGNFNPQLRANNLEQWKNEYIKHAYDWFRYNILIKHCEPALGHKVNIHALRHSRATQLYDMGKPIEIIQNLLGHREIETTMVYTEVSNKKVFDAMVDVE